MASEPSHCEFPLQSSPIVQTCFHHLGPTASHNQDLPDTYSTSKILRIEPSMLGIWDIVDPEPLVCLKVSSFIGWYWALWEAL